ncbi:2Fe-2S iron-sulfur cluster-binding protein [Breoghania sp. L-A4]|uniref:2Fe-2S iron-sulfur cluster-binding protein n=1 Tax=Breoghania sp. L-A4 TaxID=2304600 RepID=UPI000E35BF89|nr:2Fe-2S iron-sulfur cluster-binding protein [Breoghania sp. L-A4]AXS41665.1 FAD/NAD(P)-binding oxidoreductase [Breoghania sp. L-A4]
MILALQICGALIVAAALLQAGAGATAEITRVLRNRRMDRHRLAQFKTQTDILIRRAEADRQRSELTWAGKRKFRVAERRVENRCGDICSFILKPHDGGFLPPFLPGQFLTFELKIPDQPGPVVRCYSLSGSPEDHDSYRITIKRLGPPPGTDAPPGLSSNFFHDAVKPGDVLDVMAPNGGFCLDTHSDRPIVLIAGGVGLTPLLSMLKWLADTGSHRETWIFQAVRNSDDIAMRDEIRAITDNNSHFHSVVLYSQPTGTCVQGEDYDHTGFVTLDVLKDTLGTSNYDFYVCGPPPMMQTVTAYLRDWGVPDRDVHFEAFGPASVKKPHSAETSGKAIKVEFTRSGKKLIWTETEGTLLELADAHGVRISSGCRVGNCGTCSTALTRGSVSYVTTPASKPPAGSALLCIACPQGDIALDA